MLCPLDPCPPATFGAIKTTPSRLTLLAPMTENFPHVDLLALKKFAVSAALVEHAQRSRTDGTSAHNGGRGGKVGKGKASAKNTKVVPKVKSCTDVVWAGEKVHTLTTYVISIYNPADLT